MSLFKVMDIAGSALSAQSLRLNTTASNMANADSVSSSIDSTYRARHPVFATMMDDLMSFEGDSAGAGVQVRGVIESQAPVRSIYRPEHPMADENGYIHMPNVNMVEEMANMMSASRSYQMNVEIANASKQLVLSTLQLGV
ncbi:MAG: Flagellar basal-body rod protein FlgC [Gammaproteobacteria bacterium]|nr:Flagellar basal-body rod protein FlgC [Gammaproteobacteria bacterium]